MLYNTYILKPQIIKRIFNLTCFSDLFVVSTNRDGWDIQITDEPKYTIISRFFLTRQDFIKYEHHQDVRLKIIIKSLKKIVKKLKTQIIFEIDKNTVNIKTTKMQYNLDIITNKINLIEVPNNKLMIKGVITVADLKTSLDIIETVNSIISFTSKKSILTIFSDSNNRQNKITYQIPFKNKQDNRDDEVHTFDYNLYLKDILKNIKSQDINFSFSDTIMQVQCDKQDYNIVYTLLGKI